MDRVQAAFAAVDRRAFLPPGQQRSAAEDRPLPIGDGQTNSQPRTVEAMLRLLDPQPGDRVLDLGSGSGWTTALLAELVMPEGRVVGVEIRAELVALGRRHLAAIGRPNASIVRARNGVLGLPEYAPYDKILVSAEASRLPQELTGQLAIPGRMVIPVHGELIMVNRHAIVDDAATGEFVLSSHGAYRFVPLIGA